MKRVEAALYDVRRVCVHESGAKDGKIESNSGRCRSCGGRWKDSVA